MLLLCPGCPVSSEFSSNIYMLRVHPEPISNPCMPLMHLELCSNYLLLLDMTYSTLVFRFQYPDSLSLSAYFPQQKKPLLQTDRYCVRRQEIHLEHPVRPAHPQMAPAQWLHPSPLGAIQATSCPPSAPGWSIAHPNLTKKCKVSDP